MELLLHSFYFLNEIRNEIIGEEGQGCRFENMKEN